MPSRFCIESLLRNRTAAGSRNYKPDCLIEMDPHGTGPDQLAIGLLAAHVVVADAALGHRRRITPVERDFFGLRLNRVDHGAVTDNADTCEWSRPDQMNPYQGIGRRKFFAHEVISAADFSQDVVRRAVNAPLAKSVHQTF